MSILLIGQHGQLAQDLYQALLPIDEVIVGGRHCHPLIDLADPDTIQRCIREVRPKLIINAAAYTQVDLAETDALMAYRVNAKGVGVLAECAKAVGAGLIHYSTDYVFPGSSAEPYLETSQTAPINTYGHSKHLGEVYIQNASTPHVIFRTSWVYGLHGRNFLKTMLNLMANRKDLGVVADQMGSPTWSKMIATATAHILDQNKIGQTGHYQIQDWTGTYHLTASGGTSWFGFAKAIRKHAIDSQLLPSSVVMPKALTTADYPTPAKRPAYSMLSNRKIQDTFGLYMPNWETQLELCLRHYPGASTHAP